jgi:hypothetical protein
LPRVHAIHRATYKAESCSTSSRRVGSSMCARRHHATPATMASAPADRVPVSWHSGEQWQGVCMQHAVPGKNLPYLALRSDIPAFYYLRWMIERVTADREATDCCFPPGTPCKLPDSADARSQPVHDDA